MIHETAHVASGAQIADDVEIGAFTVVHDNVALGTGCRIGSHCSIGEPTALAERRFLNIAEQATIRSHSVIYQGSTIGPRLETGHHVTLREGLDVGTNLRVGTRSDLQGDTRIGDFVRLHSNVFVAKASDISDFVWIFPGCVLTDDPHPPSDCATRGVTIERFAVISAMSCIGAGIRIHEGSVVGAASMVTRDVPPGTLVVGVPARPVGPAAGVRLRDGSGRPAYPWTGHFTRGYPPSVVRSWEPEA